MRHQIETNSAKMYDAKQWLVWGYGMQGGVTRCGTELL